MMIRKAARLIVGVPVLTLALARCGSSDSEPGPSATGGKPSGGSHSAGADGHGGRSASGGSTAAGSGGTELTTGGAPEGGGSGPDASGGAQPEPTGGAAPEPSGGSAGQASGGVPSSGGSVTQSASGGSAETSGGSGTGGTNESSGGDVNTSGGAGQGGVGDGGAAGSGGAGGAQPCASGRTEVGGVCKVDDGGACSRSADCVNGHCISGVCCAVACNEPGACSTASGATCPSGRACLYRALSCDDGDSCTQDRCEAQSGCSHVNPSLNCGGWAGAACAGETISSLVSGEQSVCVTARRTSGVNVCANQTCPDGRAGCAMKYRTESVGVSSTSAGFTLNATVVQLSGTITTSGSFSCSFPMSLTRNIPIATDITYDRAGCSEGVSLNAGVRADWSAVQLSSSGILCNAVASALRTQLPGELNGAIVSAVESLTCAACDDDCPHGLVCR